MGIIRGAGVVIFSIVLFISLLCGGVCLTLAMSLNYENVQPTVVDLSKELVGQEIDLEGYVNQIQPLLEEYCKNNSEYVFNFEGATLVIPCDLVDQGVDSIIDYALNESITEIVDEYYYKDYDCNLVECINQGEPTFFLSKEARDYWMSKFYLFLGISILFVVLIFILMEKKSNWFFLVGALFVGSSLIISRLNSIGAAIAKAFLVSVSELFSGEISQEILQKISGLFFIESKKVFILMLLIGIGLIILGILFKIFKLGLKINNMIEKARGESKEKEPKEKLSKEDVKKIVKEEVSKEKSKSNIKPKPKIKTKTK